MAEDPQQNDPTVGRTHGSSVASCMAADSEVLGMKQKTNEEPLTRIQRSRSSDTSATQPLEPMDMTLPSQNETTNASKDHRKDAQREGEACFYTRTVTMAAKELPMGFLTPETRKELHPNQLLKFDLCFHPAVAESDIPVERALVDGLALPISPITPENSVVHSPDDTQLHKGKSDKGDSVMSSASTSDDGCKTPRSDQIQSKAPRPPRRVTFRNKDDIFQLPPPTSVKLDKTMNKQRDKAAQTKSGPYGEASPSDSQKECDYDSEGTLTPTSSGRKKNITGDKPMLPELNFKTSSDEFSEVFVPVGGRDLQVHVMNTLGNTSMASETLVDSDIYYYGEDEFGEDALIQVSDFPQSVQQDLMLPMSIRGEPADELVLPDSPTLPSDTPLIRKRERPLLVEDEHTSHVETINCSQSMNTPRRRSSSLPEACSHGNDVSPTTRVRQLPDILRRQPLPFRPGNQTIRTPTVAEPWISSSNQDLDISFPKIRQANCYSKSLDLRETEASFPEHINQPSTELVIPDIAQPPGYDHFVHCQSKVSALSGLHSDQEDPLPCTASSTTSTCEDIHHLVPSSLDSVPSHPKEDPHPKPARSSSSKGKPSPSFDQDSHQENLFPGGSVSTTRTPDTIHRRNVPSSMDLVSPYPKQGEQSKSTVKSTIPPHASPHRSRSNPDLRIPPKTGISRQPGPIPVIQPLNVTEHTPSFRHSRKTSHAYHLALQDLRARERLPLIAEGNENLTSDTSHDHGAQIALLTAQIKYHQQSWDPLSKSKLPHHTHTTQKSSVYNQNKDRAERDDPSLSLLSQPTEERGSGEPGNITQSPNALTEERVPRGQNNFTSLTAPTEEQNPEDRPTHNISLKVPTEEGTPKSHHDFTSLSQPTEKKFVGGQTRISPLPTTSTQDPDYPSPQPQDKSNVSKTSNHLTAPTTVPGVKIQDFSSVQGKDSLPKSRIHIPVEDKILPNQHLYRGTKENMCLKWELLTGHGSTSGDDEAQPARLATQGAVTADQPRRVAPPSASARPSGSDSVPASTPASAPAPISQQPRVEPQHSHPIPITRQLDPPHVSSSLREGLEFSRNVGRVPRRRDQGHAFPRSQYSTMAQGGFYNVSVGDDGPASGNLSVHVNRGSMAESSDEDESMIPARDRRQEAQEEYTSRYRIQGPMQYTVQIPTAQQVQDEAQALNETQAHTQTHVQNDSPTHMNGYQSETRQNGNGSVTGYQVNSPVSFASSPSYGIRGNLNGYHSDTSVRSQPQGSQYQGRDDGFESENLAPEAPQGTSEHLQPLVIPQTGDESTILVTSAAPSGDVFTTDPDRSNMIYSATSGGPTAYVQNSPTYVSTVEQFQEAYYDPSITDPSGHNTVGPVPSAPQQRGGSLSPSVRGARYLSNLGDVAEDAAVSSGSSPTRPTAEDHSLERLALRSDQAGEHDSNRYSTISAFDYDSIIAASTPQATRVTTFGPPLFPPPTSPLPATPTSRRSQPPGPAPTSPLPPTPPRREPRSPYRGPSASGMAEELSPSLRQAITDTVNTVVQRALAEQALTQGAGGHSQPGAGVSETDGESDNADLSIDVGGSQTDSTQLAASQAGGGAGSQASSIHGASLTSPAPEIVGSGGFSAPASYDPSPFTAPSRVLSSSAPGVMAAPAPWYGGEGIDQQASALHAKDAQARAERMERDRAREQRKLTKKASKQTLREETGESSRSGMVDTVLRALRNRRTSSKASSSDAGSNKSVKRPDSPDPDPDAKGKGKATY